MAAHQVATICAKDVLTCDIWHIVASMLDVSDTGPIMSTCRAWKRIFETPHMDWVVASAYAVQSLGDPVFWKRAALRPADTRKTLPTYRLEIERIERFRRAVGLDHLAACELYSLWNVIDSFSETVRRPPRTKAAAAQPEHQM